MAVEKSEPESVKKGSSNVEAEVMTVSVELKNGLKRQMKDRHITMIRYEQCVSRIHTLFVELLV